jgi:hypothetical protein
MKLKKYTQFVKESVKYDLGCVMLQFKVDNWNEITDMIDKDDIYLVEGENYGIENAPHLTLLYGLTQDVTRYQVSDVLNGVMLDFRSKGVDTIKVEIEGIGIFENDDFDVVKFNIKKNSLLQNLFDSLSNLPNENKFKDYLPHSTIAYVKKGLGKKYVREYSHKLKSNQICYSMASGEKVNFDI